MLPGNFSHKIFKFSAKSIDSLSQNSSPRFLSRGELRERMGESDRVSRRDSPCVCLSLLIVSDVDTLLASPV